MQDMLGKLTFGFLVSQFVPGAVLVLSLLFTVRPFGVEFDEKWFEQLGAQAKFEVQGAADGVVLSSASRFTAVATSVTEGSGELLLFLLASIVAGVSLHGLNWAVLASLENQGSERDADDLPINQKAVFKSFWHRLPIIVQVMIGPVKMGLEIIRMLFYSKDVYDISVTENIQRVDAADIEKYRTAQEFYLYFAQFYSHTAYALLVLLVGLLVSIIFLPQISYLAVLAAFVGLWFSCGWLFVLGRSQFATLFRVERDLARP